VLWVVGLFVDDSALVVDRLVGEVRALVGASGAEALGEILRSIRATERGGTAAIVAFGALVIGATTAFAELKESLDEIWHVRRQQVGGWWGLLRTRLLSLGMVFVLAFLLLVSLAINAAAALLSDALSEVIGLSGATALRVLSMLVTTVIITLLFASIYKLLPAISLRWRDVGRASFVTALLFMVGQIAIGAYIGNSAAASAYGAAGSLAAMLLWIYYSAAVFFLGAELTRLWVQPNRKTGEDSAPSPPGELREGAGDAAAAGGR
jgi:membrane protein